MVAATTSITGAAVGEHPILVGRETDPGDQEAPAGEQQQEREDQGGDLAAAHAGASGEPP